MSATKRPWLRLAVSGVLSAACYAALFAHEQEVMAASFAFMVASLAVGAFIIIGAMVRGYRTA